MLNVVAGVLSSTLPELAMVQDFADVLHDEGVTEQEDSTSAKAWVN